MTEPELLAEIIKLCDQASPPVRWVHLTMVRREHCPWLAGLPDLLLVGSAGMAWREIKAASTPLTGLQDNWLTALEHAGGDADIWQERDLYDGSVRAEILALNGINAEREAWIPEDATEAEAEHRRTLYGR